MQLVVSGTRKKLFARPSQMGNAKPSNLGKRITNMSFIHKERMHRRNIIYYILLCIFPRTKMLTEHCQIETRASERESGDVCTYCGTRMINLAAENAANCDYSFNNLLSTSYLFMLSKFNISQITKLFTYQTFLTSF